MASPSVSAIHRALVDAMHRAGCAPANPADLILDGQLHRFRVDGDKPRSRNGWLVIHRDGIPAGAFGSWKTGVSVTWHAEATRSLTPAEQQDRQRQLAAAQARRQEAMHRAHRQAMARAAQLWQRAQPRVDAHHPYLQRKQVPALGVRQLGTNLVVPLRDLQGQLHGLQFITPAGDKCFLTGSVIAGNHHVLGRLQENTPLLVCEGYATGASLHRASGLPVVVAFTAGNLLAVARGVRQRYPTAPLWIAADDDRHTPGNPGQHAAEQAAQAVAGQVLLPRFSGLDGHPPPTDFNDLQVVGGMAQLQAQLAPVLEARPPPTRARSGSRQRRAAQASPPPGHRNLYQDVTDRIIALIEQGMPPWRIPWDRPRHPQVPTQPINAVTGKPYHGINRLLLQTNDATFDDPRWCGFHQARTAGWQVKAGEHGTRILVFKRLERPAEPAEADLPDPAEDAADAGRTVCILRWQTVFHASQLSGIPSLEETYGSTPTLPDHRWPVEARLEAILVRSGAHITHGGDRAYYSPSQDRIVLPPPARYPSPGHYYATAFHELAHWTGHESRLQRAFAYPLGSTQRAREELRAELASAFLGAEVGLDHALEQHAAYLSDYLQLLRNDNREIFRAAQDAQAIVDLILDRHPQWRLEQGVCVRRGEAPPPDSDPLPSVEPAGLVIAVTPPAVIPADPSRPVAGSGFTRITGWVDEALRALALADDDGGSLGQLVHRIDTALADTAALADWAPGDSPAERPGPPG